MDFAGMLGKIQVHDESMTDINYESAKFSSDKSL